MLAAPAAAAAHGAARGLGRAVGNLTRGEETHAAAGGSAGPSGLHSLRFSLWPDGFVWTGLSICNFIKV
ncbi:hypothetical protein MC885_003488, partial [Smutsia gigantea]